MGWADAPIVGDDQQAPPKWQSAPVVQPVPSGIGQNLKAGFIEGLTSLPSLITDPASKMLDAALPFLSNNSAPAGSTASALGAGRQNTNPIPAGSISHTINKGLGAIGQNPEDVQAITPAERVARVAGAGATALLAPEAELPELAEEGASQLAAKFPQTVIPRAANTPLATTVKKAVTGAGAGAGSGLAQEAVPDDDPNAKALAGLVGGIGGGLATEAPGIAAYGAGRLAKVVDRWRAPLNEPGREGIVANTIRNSADDSASLLNLDPKSLEIIPGSEPTVGQATGDQGLAALERGVAAKNSGKFTARRAEQNVARSAALSTLQQPGDPREVAQMFSQQLADIDAQTEAAVNAARQQGEARVAGATATGDNAVSGATALGQQAVGTAGTGNPEDYGTSIRNTITAAEDVAKARTSKLYDAIDPDGTLTGNMATTRQAAKDILGQMSPTSMPMTGTEADIFEKAQTMPQLAPARDLIELNKYVNAAMKAELKTGATPSYARLSQLRGAIQNNIDNTISDRVAAESEAVKNGHLSSDDTLWARLNAEANEWKSQRAETGRAAGNDVDQPASIGPSAIPGQTGTEGAPPERSGDVEGSESVPEQPTFDDAAAQRLAEASASHAQRKQTFGISPISDITKSSGMKGQFTLPTGAVPAKVFHPGAKGFQDVQATLTAAPESLPVIEDYAAMSLRRAALRDDGTIDPDKFERWSAQHQDALRALPDATRARFADAATAGNAVDEAVAGRTAAIRQAQDQALRDVAAATANRKTQMSAANSGIMGRFSKLSESEDVTDAVSNLLNGSTSVADMKALSQAVKDNPMARDGLRRAIADGLVRKVTSNAETTTSSGVPTALLKPDVFQNYVRDNRAALSHIMSPEELQTLDAISADLKRANRSITSKLPGGSNTAQDMAEMAKGENLSVLDRILMEAGATTAGAAIANFPGAAVAWLGAKAANAFRTSGMQKVDDLLSRAMLDPALAKDLLLRNPPRPDTGAAINIANRLRRIGYGTAAAQLGGNSQPQPQTYAEGGLVKKIDKAANVAHPKPSPLQVQSGNYPKGHIRLHGLDITVETPRGKFREGFGADGKTWKNKNILAHYGYLRGTSGSDSEHIDAYVGPNPHSQKVFVVNQVNPKDKSFDEHKVIIGAKDLAHAHAVYDAGFSDRSGPWRRGSVAELSVPDFKTWLKTGDTKAPLESA